MKYFNLFSNVLPVKGYSRMLICDLQRNVSELYPLDLYYILEELKQESIENVLQTYDEDSKEIFNEYLNLLLEKEYGFVSENEWDRNFPPMPYKYQDPTTISNIVIEFDNIDVLYKIRESIENLLISHLVIFTRKKLSTEDFKEIDNCFKNSCLEGIEIYTPFYGEVDTGFINTLNENTLRLYHLVFYNCGKFQFGETDEIYRFSMNFIKEDLCMKSCGKVDLKYLSTNTAKVLEAINHNSCLHKKIAIDIDGNIRNCPAMPFAYGNIKDTTLKEALNKKGFKRYWNLTKDDIEVCKDCEFRYICTDCRAFTERTHTNKEGLDTSKPLKCGYDPYTAKWEEWSTNPLKQKAIDFYEMREIIQKQ